MSVSLEYSYNISKDGSEKGYKLCDLAYDFGAIKCDTQYEFEGVSRQMRRSHCVIIITFGDDESCTDLNEEIVNEFIKQASLMSRVYLECIYNSDNELIYTSRYFKNKKETK